MNTVDVRAGQCLFDVLVEHLGGISNVIQVCVMNDISVTGDLSVGQSLTLTDVENEKISNLFGNLHTKPATALTRDDITYLVREVGDNPADFGTFDFTFDDTFYKYSLI